MSVPLISVIANLAPMLLSITVVMIFICVKIIIPEHYRKRNFRVHEYVLFTITLLLTLTMIAVIAYLLIR